MASRAPSRLEVLLLGLGLAAAALLAGIPRAGGPARAADQTLEDRLNLLRAAIFRFSMDHVREGRSLWPGQGGEDPVRQLTGPTRLDGATRPSGGHDDRLRGPYLRRIPVNPVNGLATLRCMSEDRTEPEFLGTHGWVYVPATGRVYPDLPGDS